MKKKPIYGVWIGTKYGIGLQFVKADNKTEAKAKFNKRFKNKKIIDVDLVEDNYNNRSKAI